MKLINIVLVLFVFFILGVLGYSEYGAPSEFGNLTDTTCWIGGDYGILNCTGEAYFGSGIRHYYNKTEVNTTIDTKILINNNSIVTWVNNIISNLGNWSKDKEDYYNITQIDNNNDTMRDYVLYVNSTNTGGGSSYDDTWINTTINNSVLNYTKTVSGDNDENIQVEIWW